MKNTRKAFFWIMSILKKNKIPFRISGGFAAKIYGSKRTLADIDIEINEKNFDKILPYVNKYLLWGPKRYKDNVFNTYGMSMKYSGQVIDISGTDTEILFDKRKKKWIKSRINLSDVSKREVYGIIVPIIRKSHLIAYKKKILRDVDLIDIEAIK